MTHELEVWFDASLVVAKCDCPRSIGLLGNRTPL